MGGDACSFTAGDKWLTPLSRPDGLFDFGAVNNAAGRLANVTDGILGLDGQSLPVVPPQLASGNYEVGWSSL